MVSTHLKSIIVKLDHVPQDSTYQDFVIWVMTLQGFTISGENRQKNGVGSRS